MAGELLTSQYLLTDARREIVTLATAKSEAERDAATYKKDATMAHTMVRDMSMAAQQRLTRAIEYAKAKAKRESLEELEARGFELSADLEEACAVEGRLALMSPLRETNSAKTFSLFANVQNELLSLHSPRRRKYLPGSSSSSPYSAVIMTAASTTDPRMEDKADELEQLWVEVGKAKREFNEIQAHMNARSEAKERAQAGASALEAQIQAARANDSARAR
ncbi:uncharacterized protein [Nicotiana sylvestris]|uniref:uncharacterized protein n=1 Tax=Nicotiana sylvestris TaxID=4096 RepID=UPI00388C5D59